jgi:hypothetical protein
MLNVVYAERHLCYMSFMPSVTNRPFMLSVIMLNVIMLSVIMLSVIVPTCPQHQCQIQKKI